MNEEDRKEAERLARTVLYSVNLTYAEKLALGDFPYRLAAQPAQGGNKIFLDKEKQM